MCYDTIHYDVIHYVVMYDVMYDVRTVINNDDIINRSYIRMYKSFEGKFYRFHEFYIRTYIRTSCAKSMLSLTNSSLTNSSLTNKEV